MNGLDEIRRWQLRFILSHLTLFSLFILHIISFTIRCLINEAEIEINWEHHLDWHKPVSALIGLCVCVSVCVSPWRNLTL